MCWKLGLRTIPRVDWQRREGVGITGQEEAERSKPCFEWPQQDSLWRARCARSTKKLPERDSIWPLPLRTFPNIQPAGKSDKTAGHSTQNALVKANIISQPWPFSRCNDEKYVSSNFLSNNLDRTHISLCSGKEFTLHEFDIKDGCINQAFHVIFKILKLHVLWWKSDKSVKRKILAAVLLCRASDCLCQHQIL